MFKFAGTLLAFGLAGAPLFAQQPTDTTASPTGPSCAMPDTVLVTGNSRVDDAAIRGTTGLVSHMALNSKDIQRAVKALFGTGNFDDVSIVCRVTPATQKAELDIRVKERPVLGGTAVTGVEHISKKEVKERLDPLTVGTPVDPALVAKAVERTDSLYASKGYYLAKIRVDSAIVDGLLTITLRIDEGRRMSVSGIKVAGARGVPAAAVVGAMQTKPEGFWWFRKGEFDESKYAGDLNERIPGLYGSRGYIDARVVRDTMLVDRTRAKGELNLEVQEGPRYTVGRFEVTGNRHLSNEEVRQFYPFDGNKSQSLAQGAMGFLRRSYKNPNGTFSAADWDAATDKLKEAYSDQGYIYAEVRPIEERVPSTDSVRKVNLRWDIDEKSPAIVNRIDILGNDFTYESCIRQQIVMAPGQVFNRAALIRSYQNIGNLNFFESPMKEPEVKPDSVGDVDLIFHVAEKRTGNVNFGASMGEGTGLGGFIGLDQPNLFGRCKRAQLQWQFGRYVNDFNLTYQDPNVRQSQVSASVTAYHTLAKYRIADLGQSTRTGGQLQFGFPVRGSLYSRLFLSYGGEAVKYDESQGLLSTLATTCDNCFRSTLGLTFQHDTRIGQPFPMAGAMQSFSAQFNGGPLGGTSSFQKYSTEVRSYSPILQIGAQGIGAQPMTLLFGLSARAGAVLGDPGPFFSSQSFALGGTQYGEALRGYCEFAITPSGYDPTACDGQAKRSSFGNAFFVGTAELGFRLNQSMYINGFFEAGNVWDKPREFDPTRLFRSVGIGGSTLSPLGPLGLDFAYGLDRVDAAGRKDPRWKVHFKLGQIF